MMNVLLGLATLRTLEVAPLLAQELQVSGETILWLAGGIVVVLGVIVAALVLFSFGNLWLQAFMSNARVSFLSLIGMYLRQVHPRTIVEAKIMAMQAGVGTDPQTGITTRRLEAHYLAGGNAGPTSIWISTARPRLTWRGVTCSTQSAPASIPRSSIARTRRNRAAPR
jgi:hypothetical protein